MLEDTIRVTASEFQKSFGAMSDKALKTPVTITKQGRDHLVVLAADEYKRLERRDRKAGLAEDLSEEMLAAVLAAKAPDAAAAFNHEVE